MALTIGDNFKYQANKPNFERDSFATLEAMKAYPETSIDDGHLSYCAETNKHYKFLSSNTVDETTGKWREFETTVGNNFPSDGVEGQYLKKSNTGVKWDNGDVFYLNPGDLGNSVTQDTYNKLVNAITNNKIIYIVSNFGGENRAISPIESYYNESIGITIDTLTNNAIVSVHINPDLTVEQKERISFNLDGYVKFGWFVLKTFNISENAVTYSPTIISGNDTAVFLDAYHNRHRLQLLLGSGSDKWVDLFPTQFNTGDTTKYSFIGITKYNDKCYTILLSLSSADDRDWQLVIEAIPHFYIENSTFRNNQFIKRKEDNTYEWSTIEYPRTILSEFSTKKFFGEYSMVVGADSIGWAGALLIDDFSSDKYRDFYCCMTYGQGIVIRHTYATDTYEYLNSFLADFSTTSSSYTQMNKMNSGGWGKVYDGSALPLAYISRCSPDTNYIHTYYAYQIDTSVTPYNFVKKLTIKYSGSKLADITSDITVDAEKKYLYIHGYKTDSTSAIEGTSLVMVFNLPEPGNSDTITLTDNDIVREFEFFVDEAAQDLHVSGGRLYYPYGGPNHHGLAVIDTSNGAILQNIDLTNISTKFINSPEPEGVYVSNGKLYLNYHHSSSNKNEVCLVEFPLQGVKESIPVATTETNGLMSAEDKTKLNSLNVDGGSTVVTDERALKGATMRFNGFVNGVNITQTGVNEWDGIVYDTSINKFLAKKGTLTPTYHNVWSGMDAYMSDELGTSILKDKLYICDDVVYSWSDVEGTLVKVDKEISNATQSKAGLMSAEDKAKLDNLDTSGGASDPRALNGATMRFNSFVSGVTTAQVGASEWDSIVYDTSINKFLAKKGTLSPTYYNIWSGMDAYMTDGAGTDILKDRLYLYEEDIYAWSDTEGTLIKVTPDIPNASQSKAGLMSAEDKTKLDNVISRIVLSEFSEKKFFGEFSKVTGASAIGWAGALFIDDFSSSEYRDFYCCMTYGQGIVIRHTYKTGVYEYLNSFMVDSSTTSSSYNITNKMNSGGWGKCYNNSELPLAYISRCSPNASYIHTYYAYKINRSVTPFAFERVLTIKYGGSKLAAITSDITIDAEKKYLYVHGYKSGSADAITGTSIVMVFNLPEPGSSDTVTLNDSDILWEFEFFINEAAQDLCVSGGKLYYPYGSGSLHGLAIIDTKTGKIIQNLDLSTLSTNFIDNPEPEGVALSNGNVYLNYHHSGTNSNEVCLVEFPLQEVKEALKVPTKVSQLENDANYLTANKDILESVYMYGIEFDTTIADPTCTRIGNPELHRTLPIQSKMRGCLLDDEGVIVKYLNPDTWVDEVLDGSMGQVMVEIPEFYIKFEEDGTKRKVKMSLVPIASYLKVSKAYISAYEATVQRSTNKLSSVCNEDADYRGGNNDSSYDETYRTMLGMPATDISLNNFRTYARNRGSVKWNCNLYLLHKILWWLYAVEYANFNSQDTFNATLDENGYHQGGLGEGVTTIKGWRTFNGMYPLVPCGVTNSLGNHTGTVNYNVINSEGSTHITFAVPRYHGIENLFGHLWKWTDGCKCIIQSEASGALSKFYVCDDPAKFTVSGVDNYDYRGNLPRKEGYVKALIFGEDGEIMPLEVGGGSTTYLCDYSYTNIPSSREYERGVLIGGAADGVAISGLVSTATYRLPTVTSGDYGTRLCFIPNYN